MWLKSDLYNLKFRINAFVAAGDTLSGGPGAWPRFTPDLPTSNFTNSQELETGQHLGRCAGAMLFRIRRQAAVQFGVTASLPFEADQNLRPRALAYVLPAQRPSPTPPHKEEGICRFESCLDCQLPPRCEWGGSQQLGRGPSEFRRSPRHFNKFHQTPPNSTQPNQIPQAPPNSKKMHAGLCRALGRQKLTAP